MVMSTVICWRGYLFPQLDDIEAEKGLVYFQQDGVPPHFSLRVREALDAKLGKRWIGGEGPIPWPPRRSDLIPLDFFFWGISRTLCMQRKFVMFNISGTNSQLCGNRPPRHAHQDMGRGIIPFSRLPCH